MEKQTKQIKRRVYQLCWYMRGGVTSDEAWTLSFEDKEIIDSVINENITNTTGFIMFLIRLFCEIYVCRNHVYQTHTH